MGLSERGRRNGRLESNKGRIRFLQTERKHDYDPLKQLSIDWATQENLRKKARFALQSVLNLSKLIKVVLRQL
jgi:hypothetical protein